jgi:hypothetical protein
VAQLDAALAGCRGGCGITGLGIVPADGQGARVQFVCRGYRPTQAELNSLAVLIVYDTLVYAGHDSRLVRICASAVPLGSAT